MKEKMKIESMNIYKKNAIDAIEGIEYHIYSIVVYPVNYSKTKYNRRFSLPIIVEFNERGEFVKIGSYELYFTIDDDEGLIELTCLDPLMKEFCDRDQLMWKKIPIRKLLIDHWGEDYLKNILNHLSETDDGMIPHSESMITKDFNEFSKWNYGNHLFIGGNWLFNADGMNASEVNLYTQLMRSERINKIKERISVSA